MAHQQNYFDAIVVLDKMMEDTNRNFLKYRMIPKQKTRDFEAFIKREFRRYNPHHINYYEKINKQFAKQVSLR